MGHGRPGKIHGGSETSNVAPGLDPPAAILAQGGQDANAYHRVPEGVRALKLRDHRVSQSDLGAEVGDSQTSEGFHAGRKTIPSREIRNEHVKIRTPNQPRSARIAQSEVNEIGRHAEALRATPVAAHESHLKVVQDVPKRDIDRLLHGSKLGVAAD